MVEEMIERLNSNRENLLDEAVLLNGVVEKRVTLEVIENAKKHFPMIRVDPYPYSIKEASNEDLLEKFWLDKYWNDFLPVYVCLDPCLEVDLIGGSIDDVLSYLKRNAFTVERIREVLERISKMGILKYDYFIKGMISLCNFITEEDVTIHEPPRKRLRTH